MDDRSAEQKPSSSGRILRRHGSDRLQQQEEEGVRSSKLSAGNQRAQEINEEPVNSEEIERIIRERRQRFDQTRLKTKKQNTRLLTDEHSNRSKGSSQDEFQKQRAQKKGELMQRINQLQGRIDKQHKPQRKINVQQVQESNSEEHIRSPPPVPKTEQIRVPDKLSSESFKQLLEDMRLRHRQEIQALTRHNELKVRSLESMLRSKDSIIKQLELEATRTREYIQQLQKALNTPT